MIHAHDDISLRYVHRVRTFQWYWSFLIRDLGVFIFEFPTRGFDLIITSVTNSILDRPWCIVMSDSMETSHGCPGHRDNDDNNKIGEFSSCPMIHQQGQACQASALNPDTMMPYPEILNSIAQKTDQDKNAEFLSRLREQSTIPRTNPEQTKHGAIRAKDGSQSNHQIK